MSDKLDELMYHAGLTAQGCWDELDSYTKEAIIQLAHLIIKESCQAIENWKGEPFPFDENLAISLIKEHFNIR